MKIHYEDITTLIPNCTMKKMYINNVFKTYNITPIKGYEIHDRDADANSGDLDENGEEIILCGYDTNMKSCPANYDFTSYEYLVAGETKMVYGNRRFCTREVNNGQTAN